MPSNYPDTSFINYDMETLLQLIASSLDKPMRDAIMPDNEETKRRLRDNRQRLIKTQENVIFTLKEQVKKLKKEKEQWLKDKERLEAENMDLKAKLGKTIGTIPSQIRPKIKRSI